MRNDYDRCFVINYRNICQYRYTFCICLIEIEKVFIGSKVTWNVNLSKYFYVNVTRVIRRLSSFHKIFIKRRFFEAGETKENIYGEIIILNFSVNINSRMNTQNYLTLFPFLFVRTFTYIHISSHYISNNSFASTLITQFSILFSFCFLLTYIIRL